MAERLLVVEDESGMRQFLEIMLVKDGYRVYIASSGEEGLEVYRREKPDLILTDVKMPGMSGLDLIREVRAIDPDAYIIALTAYASADDAARAVREGAYDYISKPFQIEDLRNVIRNALQAKRLVEDQSELTGSFETKRCFSGIVGASREMLEIFRMISRVAPSKASVLLVGESGTGKELVARAIHDRSPRADKPFVVVNCTAIPETLIESEVFGHVKGAYTGALANKPGLVEEADKGTLFLDEVGDIPLPVQPKLLRFLQNKEFRRVGDNETRAVDVRVIAATNINLDKHMEQGRFREDLYYRLNVITIRIPPLRDREEDILLLVDHFLKKFSNDQGKDIQKVSSLALRVLNAYHYPGNVRELENLIERCVTLEQSNQLTAEHLPSKIVESADSAHYQTSFEIPPDGIDLDGATQDLERKLITRALEMTGGNRPRAALLLGITLRSLRYRLEKLGMDNDEAAP